MPFKQTLPNILTGFRIAVIPVICLLVFIPYAEAAWAAFVLFVLAAVSDFFDGYLARIWNARSVLGRVFDPIADKLLVGALLLCLVANGTIVTIDLIPATAIILRELLVSGLREYLGPLGIVLPVSKLAKWKTTAQLVSLAMLLLAFPLPVWTAGLIMLWLAAGLSVWTGWDYLRQAWKSLSVA
jgi:CDP-diacylglycerol--glycerol-3-phosphate 3-phosphatidyltransferase